MKLSPENPMGRVLRVDLLLQTVVFACAIPVMVTLDAVPLPVALTAGLGGVGLAIAAAGTLRRPVGYALGWLTQAVAFGLGFLTPAMFLMGGVFALLWIAAFVLGRRLETGQ